MKRIRQISKKSSLRLLSKSSPNLKAIHTDTIIARNLCSYEVRTCLLYTNSSVYKKKIVCIVTCEKHWLVWNMKSF